MGDTPVRLTDTGPVLTANVDGAGFYRVRPSAAMLDRLATDGATELRASERHGLVDGPVGARPRRRGHRERLARIAMRRHEDDLTVWQALSSGYAGLARLVDDDVPVPRRPRRAPRRSRDARLDALGPRPPHRRRRPDPRAPGHRDPPARRRRLARRSSPRAASGSTTPIRPSPPPR
ncbi:MAG: hypothetical protein R2695_11850 [Acidimicrobiales bacterium]